MSVTRTGGPLGRVTLLGVVLAAVGAVGAARPAGAVLVEPGSYRAGSTVVVKEDGQPPRSDQGLLTCDSLGRGDGGACVPFGRDPVSGAIGDSIRVDDLRFGRAVAFQVCIDNNGDGMCTSPESGPCADDIYFSHDDAGQIFNPLGPLPTGVRTGCSGGTWPGYVVFVCQGAHVVNGQPHNHPVSTGRASLVSGGTGFGTFCGGTQAFVSRKPYVVNPKRGLTCQLATVNTDPGNAQWAPHEGLLAAGPFRPTDPYGATVSDVSATCTVQASPTPGQAIMVSETFTDGLESGFGGRFVFFAQSFANPPVYVCTHVTWRTSDGRNLSFQYDAQGTELGIQCPQAVGDWDAGWYRPPWLV